MGEKQYTVVQQLETTAQMEAHVDDSGTKEVKERSGWQVKKVQHHPAPGDSQIPPDAMRSKRQRGNTRHSVSVFQLDTLEFDDPTHPSFSHLSLIPYPRSYTKTASRRPSCDTKQHVCQIHFIQTRGPGDTLWHCKTPIPSGFCKWSNQPC